LVDEIIKMDVVQEVVNEVTEIVTKPTVKIIEKERQVEVQEIKVQEVQETKDVTYEKKVKTLNFIDEPKDIQIINTQISEV